MSDKVSKFDENLLTHINSGRNSEAKSIIQSMTTPHKLTDVSNWTLLHFAADSGNGGIAQYLIDLGSDINAQNSQGQTPLMLAVQKERVTTIRVLLESKASIHVPNGEGKSALQMVVHGSLISQSTIQAFLEKLKEETSCDSRLIAQKLHEIKCPLRIAGFLANAEVTRLMLDGGNCDINDADPETGETALHIAVLMMSLENVETLIEYGANLNLETDLGYTPLYNVNVTSEDQALKILKVLLDRGAMIFTDDDGQKTCQIGGILEMASRKIIHLLMQYDIDLCETDEHGNTALHYLARNRHTGVFDELKGKKFDIDARNSVSNTPLMLVSDNFSSLKFLVSNGADVNVSRNGITPLSKIFQRAPNEGKIYKESVKILLRHGADPQSVFADEAAVDRAITKCFFGLLQPVIASLALLEEGDTHITETTRNQIDKHKTIKEYYDFCKQLLHTMKTTTVWESITKYKLLVASEKQLAMYMRQREFKAIVSSSTFSFGGYEYIMRERVKKAISTAELWEKSTAIFCDVLKLQYEKYYVLIENMIISYLSEQDMLHLCMLIEK